MSSDHPHVALILIDIVVRLGVLLSLPVEELNANVKITCISEFVN